ncbi:PqqD family peptide modification chaperone [Pararhizobium haloflavum]|uniref:PqqD family peptide modification chaperone n=1 Tax=Pararhizobium haloflavum TaxID=2037914 RepID=UPI0012FFD9BF|nr:PqqD family protein [Pararhizobium haloflavum]
MQLCCFRGLPAPIGIDPDVSRIADDLRTVLVGWPQVDPADMPFDQPFLTVSGTPDHVIVRRQPSGETRSEPSTTSAICTIIVELMAAFVRNVQSIGNLHAAAVEFGGRLVVFPATNRAGKSTLVSACAADGRRVFSDDLLPIDLKTGDGVASGCLPRIRLPLPDGAPERLKRYVESHTEVTDGYYAFLSATKGRSVQHGEKASIGAIVLLERSDQPCAARLEPVALEDGLTRLLVQDTSEVPAQCMLDAYLDLLAHLAVYRLVYSDISDAQARLEEGFSTWPATEILARSDPRRQSASASGFDWPTPATDMPVYRRVDEVAVRVVGDSAFLVDQRNDKIHHLNTLGLGLWNLLENDMDEATIRTIVAGAFADVPEEVVEADVGALLQTFLAEGLAQQKG